MCGCITLVYLKGLERVFYFNGWNIVMVDLNEFSITLHLIELGIVLLYLNGIDVVIRKF